MASKGRQSRQAPPGFSDSASTILRRLDKSSFSLAARFCGPEQAWGLRVFYAFCRAVDDAADDFPRAQAARFLTRWEKELRRPCAMTDKQRPLLVRMLQDVQKRWSIPSILLLELIQGAKSDLKSRVRFTTYAKLTRYCHQVAGVVGQACLCIWGVPLEKGRTFAELLGRAFQLINIIRDAGRDAAQGRIYASLQDLRRFQISEKEWLACRPGFQAAVLFRVYAERARECLRLSRKFSAGLSRKSILPALVMRDVYTALLDEMEKDGFRVFEKRYRVSRPARALLLARRMFLNLFAGA